MNHLKGVERRFQHVEKGASRPASARNDQIHGQAGDRLTYDPGVRRANRAR
jgi:hypothetical protein